MLLAGQNGNVWVYVGSGGTGFETRNVEYLRKPLDELKTKSQSCFSKARNMFFAPPTQIAEIDFCGWTHDGSLRHASYISLHEVQDNAAVFDMNERLDLDK